MSSTKATPKAFYLIALVLPVLLLLLVEGVLRLTVEARTYPLFVPASENSVRWQPNPDLVKRYFHHPDLAPRVSPDTQLFNLDKRDNQIRIVVMGGSTAAGFPYGRFGSLSGMLQQRFKRLYPEKDIEVLSVAMSSINTYTLIDIVDEVIDIQPDAVLVYAGHNEFLGVMGVGSSYASFGSIFVTRAFMVLREWRLFQMMQQLLVSAPPKQAEQADAHTVMASIAKHKHIEFGSDLYQKGIEQFTSNLDVLLKKLNDADVKTFVGTLASNDAGQAPFSGNPDNVPSLETCKTQQPALPEQSAEWSEQYPENADAHFCHAMALQARGDNEQAQHHFTLANDLDGLRFRAPSEFNEIIREAAELHGASLVDVRQAMIAISENGLIDNRLMLEHLHPTKRGYFVMAEAYAESIANEWMTPAVSLQATRALAWQEVPLSEADIVYAGFKIAQLTADYPFTDTPETVEFGPRNNFSRTIAWQRINGEAWLSLQQKQLNGYQQQQRWPEAAKIAGILFDALPFEARIADAAAKLHLRADKPLLAAWYAQKAVELQPDDASYRLTLAEGLFKSNQITEAISQLEEVIQKEPDNQRARYYLSQLKGGQ